ncbi:MAG: DUF6057 family protein [Bacteroidota bacterium]|nr:DUF6057 family protein [Bacteroidota bacterium]
MIRMDNSRIIRNSDVYIALGIFIVIAFIYFCFIGNYALSFQETQSLFVFSADYLREHLLKPGAPLEYIARFLTQFYYAKLTGSIVLPLILALPGIILSGINRRLMTSTALVLVLTILPSVLLMLMQVNYYHMMEYNLGFIVILAFYLLAVSCSAKVRSILVLVLFPLFYFISGAYALIFVVMYIVHNLLLETGTRRYIPSILLVIVAGLTFLIFWKVIFLQPVEQFVLFPLPLFESVSYTLIFAILTALIIIYPLICRIGSHWKEGRLNTRSYSIISAAIIYIAAIVMFSVLYNSQTARVIEIQKLVFRQKWNDAVRFQEKHPSRNLIGQYFYNIALSETDQLCDRLFIGGQDFGTGSLILPWGDVHLNRGAYFYYAIGLINEAQRWAYEEMVVYGNRPQNIELLAKTSLINGNYVLARKYINILRKTIYYRHEASEFENLADNPELIKKDPELGSKLKLIPKGNFFIQFNEPENNIPLVLAAQPDNRKAFEYYIAELLLSKNVESVVNNVKYLKEIGYTRIPRYIEEALLIYYNSQRVFPDLGGLTISNDAATRFGQYFTTYMSARQIPATLKENMQKQFGDTFWYYFHFK